jgi:hypothetical protein
MTRQGKYPVPGAMSAVVRDVLKWKLVEVKLYAGEEEAQARLVFEQALRDIRGFCGQDVGSLEPHPAFPADVALYSIKMFSPDTSLNLKLRKKTPETAKIHPNAFSVSVDVSQHARVFP